MKGVFLSLLVSGVKWRNFSYGIKIYGRNKFITGENNHFCELLVDLRNTDVEPIKIGSQNVFHTRSCLIAGGGGIIIGSKNIISNGAQINGHKGRVEIGNKVFIGPNVLVQGNGGVKIANGTMIAANTFISSSNHDISNPCCENYLANELGTPVDIGEKVWIGANSVITAGVTIGDCSVVGAGSVVTKDIPAYSMAVGSPARVIRFFDLDQKKWLPAKEDV